jgi:ribosomal protein S27AE
MPDGHVNKCKECNKKDVRENRKSKVEYYREYDSKRAKLPERIKLKYEVTRAWLKADKRRLKCHNAVHRAVKKGIIKRIDCEKCGSIKSIAHHDNYGQPLAIRWLCQACHVQYHKSLKII